MAAKICFKKILCNKAMGLCLLCCWNEEREKYYYYFLNKYDIILKAYKSEVYNISKLYKKHLYKIKDSK